MGGGWCVIWAVMQGLLKFCLRLYPELRHCVGGGTWSVMVRLNQTNCAEYCRRGKCAATASLGEVVDCGGGGVGGGGGHHIVHVE